MYVFEHNRDASTIFLHFYGELVGAEFDNATLELARSLTLQDLRGLRAVVGDLRRITCADLTHTDGARVAWFQRELRRLYRLEVAEFEAAMGAVKVARIIDGNSPAGAVFRRRMELINPYAVHDVVLVDTSIEAAARRIGQDAAFVQARLATLARRAAGAGDLSGVGAESG